MAVLQCFIKQMSVCTSALGGSISTSTSAVSLHKIKPFYLIYNFLVEIKKGVVVFKMTECIVLTLGTHIEVDKSI